MNDDGIFLWIGPVPKFGIRSDGSMGRVDQTCPDVLTCLARVTDLRSGPLDEWDLEGGALRLRGERIPPVEWGRVRVLMIDAKSDVERGRVKAARLERFVSERLPGAAILNPISGEPLFRSKIAFYEMASADPALRDIVVPHHVIRSARDVDAAIERFSFPIVVKPDDMAHGHGMRLVHDRKEFLAQVRAIHLHPFRHRVERLLQPFRETARRWLRRPLWQEHHYLNNGRVVVNPFVETIAADVGGRIQLQINYLGGQMIGIRARVITQGWNSHSPGKAATLEEMGPARFGALADVVLNAMERSRAGLTALRRALPAWPVRFDAMIDRSGRVVVSEPEFKWGYRDAHLYQGMLRIGHDPAVIAARTGLNVRIDVGALARAKSHLG